MLNEKDAIRGLFTLAVILVLSVGVEAGEDVKPFVDWANLENPILVEPDRMLKDQAVVYRDGWFYVFSSHRFRDNDLGSAEKMPCIYKTRDFKTYEHFYDPDLGVEIGSTVIHGTGSPDVTFYNGAWHLVWQSGMPDSKRRNLFYSTSTDLDDWSPAKQLNPSLRFNARRIDGALAFADGHYYVGYKSRQMFRVARSKGAELDGRWFRSRSGDADGSWAENYQFIKIDGHWHMIATARDPSKPVTAGEYTGSHEPFIYRMDGDGSEYKHWTDWTDKRIIQVPYEEWNTVMHANSAYLCDWREHDGHFYLFYAGANDSEQFQRRGHGKIGVVRSKDLINWKLPGDMSE